MIRRVYHFLPEQWAIDDLIKGRVKISKFADLNDPFELLGVNLGILEIEEFWRALIDARWGVICFSRSLANPLLWSLYADKHKGMCLGFDVPEEVLQDVRYVSCPSTIESSSLFTETSSRIRRPSAIESDWSPYVMGILLTKMEDWKYEDEVRTLVQLTVDGRSISHETGLWFNDSVVILSYAR